MTGTTKAGSKAGGPQDARFIGDVFGSLIFSGRTGEDVDVSPFRARSISTRSAVITSETPAQRGEPVALRFDGIGIRHGQVERVFKGGFIVAFGSGEEQADSLSGRIDWLKLKARGKALERRAFPRVLPRDGAARAIVARDQVEHCLVRDMSQTGAAILCEVLPPVGQLVAIGAVPGHVVRHFEGGFAVRFVEQQSLAQLEAMLTLRTDSEKQLASRRIAQAARRLGGEQ